MITNDYMRTPTTHAAYMRSTGDSFARQCAKRSTDMPVEASMIEARLKSGEVPKDQRAYMRQRVEDLRRRAPLVEQMGLNFQQTFHASAARIESEAKNVD